MCLFNSKEHCASCAHFRIKHSSVRLLGGYKVLFGWGTGIAARWQDWSVHCCCAELWPANLCIRFHCILRKGIYAKILTRLTLNLSQSMQVSIFFSTEPGSNNSSVNVRRFCKDCACNKLTLICNRMPQMGPAKAHCLSPCSDSRLSAKESFADEACFRNLTCRGQVCRGKKNL